MDTVSAPMVRYSREKVFHNALVVSDHDLVQNVVTQYFGYSCYA